MTPHLPTALAISSANVSVRRGLRPLAALTLAGVAVACGADGPDAAPETTPAPPETTTAPPTTDGSPATTEGAGSEFAVATFEVAGDETFKVELATPELEEHARALLAGENISAIPLGTVVRDDPGVNAPWSWHLDPATLEFAFATTEVCDGIPSFVEDGTVTSDQYCPWSAEVIAVDDPT